MAARKKTQQGLVPISSINDLQAPQDWASDFDQYLSHDTATASGGSGWPYLSTRGKRFKLGEIDFGDSIDVVVLGGMRENSYYEGVYDAQNLAPPSCFAINGEYDEAAMAPPPGLETKQSDTCRSCWANQFKSDDRGRGKACKNLVRLAVLNFDQGSNYEKVDGARLRVPPTSLTNWSKYVTQLANGLRRPLFSVVTRIVIVPDEVTQHKLTFEPVGVYNDRPTLDLLTTRVDEAQVHLTQLPEASAPQESKPAPVKPGVKRRKKVVRKKA